jgi:hypothetical protein
MGEIEYANCVKLRAKSVAYVERTGSACQVAHICFVTS